MNKILSQALKKAVSEYSPEVKEVSKGNRPDLFSLSTETELFQNDKGIIIITGEHFYKNSIYLKRIFKHIFKFLTYDK